MNKIGRLIENYILIKGKLIAAETELRRIETVIDRYPNTISKLEIKNKIYGNEEVRSYRYYTKSEETK